MHECRNRPDPRQRGQRAWPQYSLIKRKKLRCRTDDLRGLEKYTDDTHSFVPCRSIQGLAERPVPCEYNMIHFGEALSPRLTWIHSGNSDYCDNHGHVFVNVR